MSKDLDAKMNEMICLVKAKLNIDDKELSLMLGKAETYIGITRYNSKNDMTSDKQRSVVIKKLEWLYNGGEGIALDNHPEIFGKKKNPKEREILKKIKKLKNENEGVNISRTEYLSLKFDKWILIALLVLFVTEFILEMIVKSGILS